MTITSFAFILFVFLLLIFYYFAPKKLQWVILLVFSLLFYVLSSKWGIIYILVTASSIYGAAIIIENNSKKSKEYIKENKTFLSKEERTKYNKQNKKRRKLILVSTIILNIAILCTLKYSHFAIDQLNNVLSWFGIGAFENDFTWLVPLGLSFYTFQAIGYISDVYWNKIPAQRNYLKMLLFISFFPQVTQGPISEYKQLSSELFKEHYFTYENYSRGMQRMVWGFFKKMVISNMLAPYVNDIFANYNNYIGVTCFVGIIAHSIQLYADFSGYMDIMCGICEALNIRLAENFKRPFFSKSISEFWRRWHITLGKWVKTYIYYPLCLSKGLMTISKKSNKRFGKFVADCITTTIALTVVWFIIGFWHGASWGYIVWGLLMGLIIIVSNWLEPFYKRVRIILHMRNSNFFWKCFRILRTCLLFSFIEVIPEVGTLSNGLGLIQRVFTNFSLPTDIRDIFTIMDRADRIFYLLLLASIILLFVVSLIQRKNQIRYYYNKIPLIIRIVLISLFVLFILVLGLKGNSVGGFMYAKF